MECVGGEGEHSSGSSSWLRGLRNMNSMQLPLVVIFFMTYFIGLGGMATSAPLDPLLETHTPNS